MTRTLAFPTQLKSSIAAGLDEARRRTLDLLAPLSEAALTRQHSSLMSPLVWDFAHIGWFEELWLLRRLTGADPLKPELDDLYDAFEHGRGERGNLPLLTPDGARAYLADVRGRVLDVLSAVELDTDDRLLADGFVFGMIIQHEQQHCETILAALNLRDERYPLPDERPPAGRALPSQEVYVEGGRVTLGVDAAREPWAYDNERSAHEVDLAPFWVDAAPVTNAAYLEFVEDGGYADPRLWAQAGWAHREQAGLEHPLGWRREGDGSWSRTRFGNIDALPPEEPVQHVSWYEADAFARWAGRRLPTEAEWEAASAGGGQRRYPWGDEPATRERANLAPGAFRPAPVGGYPAGAAPCGAEHLVGDVWEWTASSFERYPGFEAFPYAEYSEVFFGDEFKVLRGGSWATHPVAIRTTFRNWDYPIRRQIFAGFRCARDA
jgi:gamma-glutamyl hercynylcysteine S-oxide synthase